MPLRTRKHPHARGEDTIFRGPCGGLFETPPRTWGRPCGKRFPASAVRNTPTHVGKTPRPAPATTSGRKHPHARGEDSPFQRRKPPIAETPPRTWGRLSSAPTAQCMARNTPTHVGKTPSPVPTMAAEGETPPRTWGRPQGTLKRVLYDENTPTHVGKTCAPSPAGAKSGKHPHARGEDLSPHPSRSTQPETPPRTWGRLELDALDELVFRNTPTHVGKTDFDDIAENASEKHPHARGEDVCASPRRGRQKETPPRTWGRPTERNRSAISRRNTPTHVGKTSCPAVETASMMKHPHARGEDKPFIIATCSALETPPRTWGRRARKNGVIDPGGNTPTHVGKTGRLGIFVVPNSETPPRTWGRPRPPCWRGLLMGNTPTHVGKTAQGADHACRR